MIFELNTVFSTLTSYEVFFNYSSQYYNNILICFGYLLIKNKKVSKTCINSLENLK